MDEENFIKDARNDDNNKNNFKNLDRKNTELNFHE